MAILGKVALLEQDENLCRRQAVLTLVMELGAAEWV